MKTRVTEILGIEKPIIQGGMAWVSDASLAAAVSEAGGLGIIGSGGESADWVRDQLEQARAKTDKPIGVNIMMLSKNIEELAKLVVDLKVDVVATGVGSPKPYVAGWKKAGIKVMPVIASVDEALEMVKAGADIVVAEGQESGGHVKEMTTMALTPAVCDAVDVPVVTAGGVVDGRGMVAAFALGAEAVQMGTRFLTAEECTISETYKKLVLEAGNSGTVVTGRLRDKGVRQLKGKFACKMIDMEQGLFEGEDIDLDELHSGSLRKAARKGNTEMGSFMAGQVVSMVNDRKPARQIVDDIMAEAEHWGAFDLQAMAEANAKRDWKAFMQA